MNPGELNNGRRIYKKNSLKERILGRTIYQKIFRFYILSIFTGAVFLCLPVSVNTDKNLNFFDSLFTATSAFTNTGLSVVTTSETFTLFGQVVLLLLIQAGGFGFVTILIILWTVLFRKKKITVEHRLFLHWERGSYNKVESLPSVKSAIKVLILAELIGAWVLTIYFCKVSPDTITTSSTSGSSSSGGTSQGTVSTQGDLLKSFWLGLFHAVSAANNAGFDILGQHSIIPYRTGYKNFLSVVLLLESVIGGIGYPVFHDISQYLKNKRARRSASLSLFTKISILTYLMVAWFGAWLAVIFEAASPSGIYSASTASGHWSGEWAGKLEKTWNIMYLTLSSRSSGFASIDPSHLTEPTKWLLSILMFIGASPASTGGGIRTVTLFIILSRMAYTSIGRKHLTIFNKTIDQSLVYESCNVFVLSTMLTALSALLLGLSRKEGDKIGDILFETSSAFGTAGLTAGITKNTGILGKITLMFLMFVGQLGVSNALISVTNLRSKSRKNCKYMNASLRII